MTGGSKIFGARDGISFDDRTKRHVFAFREQVPQWWGVRKRMSPKLAVGFGLFSFLFAKKREIPFAVVGFLLTAFYVDTYPAWVLAAPIGAAAGYYLGRALSRRGASTPPLTGKANLDGLVTDFQVQIEADERGNVELYRELYSSDPGSAKSYQPERFRISELASVERRTWDEAHPDTNKNPDTVAGRKSRAEVRDLEKVVLVFRDGQTADAGWQRSANSAARLQSGLISFFEQLQKISRDQQAEAERRAKIAPDDEPL